jgi:GAF domain-containing protein
MDYKTPTEEAALSGFASREGTEDFPHAPIFASLIQTATRELHASMQLLAARARFVTGASGVAIALQEDGQFVYCASTGTSVPGIGTQADIKKETLRQCIQDNRAIRFTSGGDHKDPIFALALPVIRKRKVSGFFELATTHGAFVDDDIQVVSRLAEMASIALDHMEAARRSENQMLEPNLGAAPEPIVSMLWHAPDRVPAVPSLPPNSPAPPPPVKIHACNSCGFPISLGRTLCLDCEEHPPRAVPTETALFTTEKQESWISAHGYTIASLLVTGLAAAIILWLR